VRINALGKQKRLKEAQEAHAEMEARGMPGNVVTYTALVSEPPPTASYARVSPAG
jgi:pentatricopeptide repeat protein